MHSLQHRGVNFQICLFLSKYSKDMFDVMWLVLLGTLRQLLLQQHYPARALRALGLLLADGTPTGGRGEDFLIRQPDFFTETAVTPERKVEKWFPRWEINRHDER